MGMTDFSIGGSDAASGYAGGVLSKHIAKSLRKELKRKDNEYNTQGYENVALVLDLLFTELSFCTSPELVTVAKKCIKMAERDHKTFSKANGKYDSTFTRQYSKVFIRLKKVVESYDEFYA